MPSYRGAPIFGYSVTMATVDNPRAQQQNAFPGLSGVESLDQGLRGRFTIVSGRMIAPDGATLGTYEANFRSYNDGLSGDLVDNFGSVWPSVKLESFEPQGRIERFANTGAYHRRYTARFQHLE